MTFVLGKLFWMVAAPGNFLTLLLAAGVVRLSLSGRRRGFGLVVTAALGFLAVAALPVDQWVIAPLEARFPIPVLPAGVDGIILLGGAVSAEATKEGGRVVLNDRADRVIATIDLARRYPHAKLVLTGAESWIALQSASEAAATRRLLLEQGIDESRLVLEERARNTLENAVYSRDIAHPKSSETWLLVTSAMHMPRAVGCFRHIGWNVIPYPVDYRGNNGATASFALSHRLWLLDNATKEWIGLLAYRLLGRIDSPFPAP